MSERTCMKSVLEYIDHNKHQLTEHALFVRLRDGGTPPRQQQLALDGMAAMLAKLVPVVECGYDRETGTLRPLSHRFVHLVWLARDAVRPAVLWAMVQSCEVLCAYLCKLCECDTADPGSALQTLAEWELVRERLRPACAAQALAVVVLDENLRQQALNLVDAVFELVEGGCNDLLYSSAPTDDAVWASMPPPTRSAAVARQPAASCTSWRRGDVCCGSCPDRPAQSVEPDGLALTEATLTR